MTTRLYVSPPVSILQFFLDTPLTATITLNPSTDKMLNANRIGDLLMVIIYSQRVDEFSGFFASVSEPVYNISGVIGVKSDGSDANATITRSVIAS